MFSAIISFRNRLAMHLKGDSHPANDIPQDKDRIRRCTALNTIGDQLESGTKEQGLYKQNWVFSVAVRKQQILSSTLPNPSRGVIYILRIDPAMNPYNFEEWIIKITIFAGMGGVGIPHRRRQISKRE